MKRAIPFILGCMLCILQVQAQNTTTRQDTISVGYTSGNQKTMSGSVEKVTEDRMNKGLVNNSLDALNGQAAGVSISGANHEAMLNSVRVRGTTSLTGGNDPLVIIDGVSSDLSTLSTIYPADIESFTILKDASETAQYGSRGASGVIEVATKKGQSGQFHISYDGRFGSESVYKNLKMLDGDAFRSVARQYGLNILDHGMNTNFPQSITRQGFVQNHHVAFGGGTTESNYRASLGLMDHNTVVKTNHYRNFTAKLDLTQKAFEDHLQVDLGVFGSFQKNHNLHDQQKLFYSAAAFNPTFSDERNASGGWDQITTASQINHPLSLLEKKDHENNAHFNTHLKLAVNLSPRLTLAAFGSYTYNVIDQSQFFPTSVWSHGQAYRSERKTEELLGNFMVNYNVEHGAHHLDLLALAEAQKTSMKGFYTTVSNFTTNRFGYNNLQAGAVRLWEGTGSYFEDPHMVSFLGRANYVLAGRYTLTVNARADASSKVGENNKWGFFPSASAAWVISDEPFMRDVTWLNNLKLRTGYGLSGNLGAIDSYNSLQLVEPIGIVNVNGAPTVSMGITQNAYPDLKWEVKRTFNVGADLAVLNNRVVLTADYYTSKTSDMLYMYNVSVPPFTYNRLLANLGSMENSGLEFGLGITPIQKRDMELNINVNLAFQKNKLVSLSGYYQGQYISAPDRAAIAGLNGAGFHGGNNNITYQIVGQTLGVFYLPHCTGLVRNEDGSYSYEIADLDGDGEISTDDGADRYIAGQATPKAMLGSNISFRYKDFDIAVQVNGAFGHKIYNGTSLTYMNMSNLPDYNVMRGAPEQRIKDQTATDYWLERGDYINIDYVTIGWNVPLPRSKYIQNLRLSASVNNLATITGYSGLTPIINSNIVNSTLGVDDKRGFPVYRSYTVGISIQF